MLNSFSLNDVDLAKWYHPTLLAKSGGTQGDERRDAGACGAISLEPGIQAKGINGGGDQNMLQVGLGESSIAGLPQPQGTDAL